MILTNVTILNIGVNGSTAKVRFPNGSTKNAQVIGNVTKRDAVVVLDDNTKQLYIVGEHQFQQNPRTTRFFQKRDEVVQEGTASTAPIKILFRYLPPGFDQLNPQYSLAIGGDRKEITDLFTDILVPPSGIIQNQGNQKHKWSVIFRDNIPQTNNNITIRFVKPNVNINYEVNYDIVGYNLTSTFFFPVPYLLNGKWCRISASLDHPATVLILEPGEDVEYIKNRLLELFWSTRDIDGDYPVFGFDNIENKINIGNASYPINAFSVVGNGNFEHWFSFDDLLPQTPINFNANVVGNIETNSTTVTQSNNFTTRLNLETIHANQALWNRNFTAGAGTDTMTATLKNVAFLDFSGNNSLVIDFDAVYNFSYVGIDTTENVTINEFKYKWFYKGQYYDAKFPFDSSFYKLKDENSVLASSLNFYPFCNWIDDKIYFVDPELILANPTSNTVKVQVFDIFQAGVVDEFDIEYEPIPEIMLGYNSFSIRSISYYP